MFARQGRCGFILKRYQGCDDFYACFTRFNDVIQISMTGGGIRIEELVAIILNQFGPLFGSIRCTIDLLAIKNIDRTFWTHNCNFGTWPSVIHIATKEFAAHNDICTTIGFSGHDADLGHTGFRKGKQDLGAVADDSAMFLIDTWQESGSIDEGDQRQIETISKTDKAGNFI